MTNISRIAVFGATGMLAIPVVKQLQKSGFKINALVRNVRKAKEIFPGEISLIEGDLNRIIDVEKIIKISDAVYCNFSVVPGTTMIDFQPENEGINNILSVAKIFDIHRIGYTASLVQRYEGMNDFHWWVFEMKNKAVDLIKESGIPYTIFYPSTFMENFSVGSYKQEGKIIISGKSKYPMWFIAGEDYGKQVARSYEILEKENKEYVIQGPEALTTKQAAQKFTKNYNAESLKIVRIPPFILNALAVFKEKHYYVSKIVEALNNYPESFEANDTWAALGKPTITIEQFAKKASEQLLEQPEDYVG